MDTKPAATSGKGKNKNAAVAGAAAANAGVNDAADPTELALDGLPGNLGKKSKNAPKIVIADPFETPPSVVPGKPGFEEGETLCGNYLRTKRIYSNKFKGNKRDSQNRKYRDLHIFTDIVTGEKFAIWGVGQLDKVLPMLRKPVDGKPGQYLELTYTGLATESLVEGQNPPHTFEFATAEGETLNADSADDDMQDAALATRQ